MHNRLGPRPLRQIRKNRTQLRRISHWFVKADPRAEVARRKVETFRIKPRGAPARGRLARQFLRIKGERISMIIIEMFKRTRLHLDQALRAVEEDGIASFAKALAINVH